MKMCVADSLETILNLPCQAADDERIGQVNVFLQRSRIRISGNGDQECSTSRVRTSALTLGITSC
ncbi:hypothetical protein MTR_1g041625 [Medicago truncatula]|uniref:Uncharacterized protein n=1 Tax=Medicago truncatula TaxID=3880 RepID=A0A072VHI7_MEDTR|nr:hypothetical protein MTR_1g041625 [Medicago truncatula]